MIPAPSFVMFCQMAFSAGVARAGGALGWVEVDELEWGKTQKFMLVVLGFLGCIFCNMKVGAVAALPRGRSGGPRRARVAVSPALSSRQRVGQRA